MRARRRGVPAPAPQLRRGGGLGAWLVGTVAALHPASVRGDLLRIAFPLRWRLGLDWSWDWRWCRQTRRWRACEQVGGWRRFQCGGRRAAVLAEPPAQRRARAGAAGTGTAGWRACAACVSGWLASK